MAYQHFFAEGERAKWLKLEVILSTNPTISTLYVANFNKFLLTLDNLQRPVFEQLTNIKIGDETRFEIKDNISLRAILVKKFIDNHNLDILKEARIDIGSDIKEIYLNILSDLINKERYPNDIFAYSIYRKRGTPTTWLTIIGNYSAAESEKLLDSKIALVARDITTKTKLRRKLYFQESIRDDLKLYLLSKPTGEKVVRGEKQNAAVQGASFTILALDKSRNRVGVISGSKKEILIVQRYLRNKVFKDSLAIPRNEVKIDGRVVLERLIKPEKEDSLVLQGLNLSKTALPNNPSFRIQSEGAESIDEALDRLSSSWQGSSISELGGMDYIVNRRKISLYTYGDEWHRRFINTATKSIPAQQEDYFLELIKERLGGIDIKETSFILDDVPASEIIEKLIRKKEILTNPPVPKSVEEIIVKLSDKKLISKQRSSVKRQCMECWAYSWGKWECPKCGKDNMQIIGEKIRILPDEKKIIQVLGSPEFYSSEHTIKYIPRKQRNNYKKGVVYVFNPKNNVATFIVIVSKKQDLDFVESHADEGFGIVAIVDPKMENKSDFLSSIGCSVTMLDEVLDYIIHKGNDNPLEYPVEEQEKLMLSRVHSKAKSAIERIKRKDPYNDRFFETDIKSMIQSLVPDVIRLGTEHSGTSVPDGYCRYGSKGKRSSLNGRRLFGWDAKYSIRERYTLGSGDVTLQKKYIKWLLDPSGQPRIFGNLGIYAIITNSKDLSGMDSALIQISNYRYLKQAKARLAVIEDALLIKICEWAQQNWEQVLENNSLIADAVFEWFRRRKSKPYTVSSVKDWKWLEKKLNKIL